MKLAGLGKLYAMLYDDRMDIHRTQEEENEDCTADTLYKPVPVYKNVKCRLSFESDDTGVDSEVDRVPVRYIPKLFCGPDVDLQAGDYVIIRRYTDSGVIRKVYEGVVSEPSWYTTHQEAFVRIDKGA